MTWISDKAFDKLLAIYEQDRILWAAVDAMCKPNGVVGIRTLALRHGINPDA